MDRDQKKVLKAKYGELYDELEEIFFRFDPQGINFEINTDEYGPEVATILPKIIKARSAEEIVPVLKEEFFKWFGSRTSNPELAWNQLASEVFAAIDRRRAAAV